MSTLPASTPRYMRSRLNPELTDLSSDVTVSPVEIQKEYPDDVGRVLVQVLSHGLDWSRNPKFWTDSQNSSLPALEPIGDPAFQEIGLRDVFESRDSERIANAFTSVSLWADKNDRARTALAFAEAAAQIAPSNPVAAWLLGLFARRRADHAVACARYQLAIRRGTEQQVWAPVGRAWLGIYNLLRTHKYYRLGQLAADKARVVAQKNGLSMIEGEAHHAVMVCLFELSKPAAALVHAEKALHLYANRRDMVAVLASDIAWYWMESEGDFAHALPIFTARLHEVSTPYDRLCVLANIARAAGGAGDLATLRWASDRVWREVGPEGTPGGPGFADALLDLAHAARSAGWIHEARRAFHGAEEIASRRHEPLREDAASLRQSIQMQTTSVEQRQFRSADLALNAAVEQLSERLLEILRATKVSNPLKRLVQLVASTPNANVPLEVECEPQDRELVERVVVDSGGKILQVFEEPHLTLIYADGSVHLLTTLVGHPAVSKIGLLVQYGLR